MSTGETNPTASAEVIAHAARQHPDYAHLELVMRLAATVKGTEQAFKERGIDRFPAVDALVEAAEAWTQAEWLRIARAVCGLPPIGEGA